MEACMGSPRTGKGPPPWESAMTAARVMLGVRNAAGCCWKMFWGRGVEAFWSIGLVSAIAKVDGLRLRERK